MMNLRRAMAIDLRVGRVSPRMREVHGSRRGTLLMMIGHDHFGMRDD